jgi:hypothetical protein
MKVRRAWVPDALAQLKFSAKHKAVDVAGMIKVGSFHASYLFYIYA